MFDAIDSYKKCPFACDAVYMRRTRERLAASHSARQRAAAEFPLRVASIAKDLRQLCDRRDDGAAMSDEANAAMQHMEDQIRICYRDVFGCELGL